MPALTTGRPGGKKLSTARRVEQEAWSKPVCEDWIARLAEEVNRAERPVVLVAHSLGIPTSVLAIPEFRKRVAGAFFVAPPEVDNPSVRPKHMMTFGPYPHDPLPFPTIVIASRNDPFGRFEPARDIAAAWGANFSISAKPAISTTRRASAPGRKAR
nr:alpha/beta hydrolase [Marinicella sp. W31]MDC2876666.1 alpha/beta hydrolase [Marinicella sp. W31]